MKLHPCTGEEYMGISGEKKYKQLLGQVFVDEYAE